MRKMDQVDLPQGRNQYECTLAAVCLYVFFPTAPVLLVEIKGAAATPVYQVVEERYVPRRKEPMGRAAEGMENGASRPAIKTIPHENASTVTEPQDRDTGIEMSFTKTVINHGRPGTLNEIKIR